MTQDDLGALEAATRVRRRAELPAEGRLDAEKRKEIRRHNGLLPLN
jgi:hypothetical protein